MESTIFDNTEEGNEMKIGEICPKNREYSIITKQTRRFQEWVLG